MPKSKRARVVSLTKVQKKGKERKEELVDAIRAKAQISSYCHVVEFSHPKTILIQQLRDKLRPDRLFAGKNRLIQVALGTTPSQSLEEGLYKLSAFFTGTSAILCGDNDSNKLLEILKEMEESPTVDAFAQEGDLATEDVILEAGFEALSGFSHSMEPELRALGLPTRLHQGKIELLGTHIVCRSGEPLTNNAAKTLKHLGIKMSKFEVILKATWSRTTGGLTIHRK